MTTTPQTMLKAINENLARLEAEHATASDSKKVELAKAIRATETMKRALLAQCSNL